MKQRIRSAIVSASLQMRQHKPENAIVLSCDPRSGSTWLSEVLSASIPSAVIWEPFHRDHVPQIRDIDFAWRQYIPPEAHWPEAEALVRKILAGGVVNEWTTWASPVTDFVKAERLIVKCCRANGFLPWMVRRVAFQKRPIHFLRHPFAIAASQIRMGNFDTAGMAEDLARGRYASDLEESAAYIRGLETPEEKIVGMWCRTQKTALEDEVTRARVTRMYYETLTVSPAAEIERLFAGWRESVPENALAQVQKASRMTQDQSLLEDPEQQVNKWRSKFSDRQVERMCKVLLNFDITLYGEGPMPNLG
ncbi:sulfotransferase family protein [Loktanella sp. S4079]|uniref:sulfotransferase family protein n=1 Tax=Loktanella sp. S4079 TaxID=579483 RepID=UPI0005FA7C12|nr:sulfotransferase family protein [Loktanella sp. S4079]KJZ18627.1 hypothetical protein TW80_14605 [Loktanella sp. S4079]